MSVHQYDILRRVTDLKKRFEQGQGLNCTDIAALYGVSTKTAQRYLNLLRDHFKLELTYDAGTRSFSLTH